jgi:NADH-quinone oxidoreductase subunit I
MFTPAVTIQYPDVKLKLPDRARNRLYVNMDDCIGCDQCSMACPVNCITIETIKSTPDVDLGLTSVGTKKRLYVPRFDIDIAKCCYCGLCVYPCPTECIKMTDVFEFSEYERSRLIYNFSTMTAAEVDQAKAKLAAHEEKEAKQKETKGTAKQGTQ